MPMSHGLMVWKYSKGGYSIRKTSSGGHTCRATHYPLQTDHCASPEMYSGQVVLVAGLGSTAADVACDLVGYANKIYLSHRRGNHVVSSYNHLDSALPCPDYPAQLARWCKGKPLDMISNRRMAGIVDAISAFAPQATQKLFDNVVGTLADSCFDLAPEWNFKPTPSILTHRPLISDHLVDHLRNESIISVGGLKRFIDGRVVELADGSTLEVDVVVFCTGYTADFSLMPENSPIAASDSSKVEQTFQVPPLARLYKNIFLPSHPNSIAYLSSWTLADGIMPLSDLTSMAVTQVWKGTFELPSEEVMNRDIDAHHTWARMIAGRGGTFPEIVNRGPWINWLNDAAGTGVNENLGYGLQGWLYWLSEPGFCSLLMTGVDSPHILRLFDGRRKSWVGARDAILRVNKDAQMRIKEHLGEKKLS